MHPFLTLIYMKILTYKSRFKLILDIIFNPGKVREEIQLEKQETIDRLVRENTEKLNMIGYEQYKNGVVHQSISRNQVAISRMPVIGPDYMGEDGKTPVIRASIEYKDVYPIYASYMGEHVSSEDIKKHLSEKLARVLVEDGFIQTVVRPHDELVFYVNAFK